MLKISTATPTALIRGTVDTPDINSDIYGGGSALGVSARLRPADGPSNRPLREPVLRALAGWVAGGWLTG